MNREIEKELWEKAQKIAKEKYEEECGWISSWDEADKYEKQDCVFAEFEVLKTEYEKLNNNETTNKNLNKRGNDIMMERKMNNVEKRMETLKANGVNVDNFFNLTLSVPFGKEVRILVDGKEVTVSFTSLNHTS